MDMGRVGVRVMGRFKVGDRGRGSGRVGNMGLGDWGRGRFRAGQGTGEGVG